MTTVGEFKDRATRIRLAGALAVILANSVCLSLCVWLSHPNGAVDHLRSCLAPYVHLGPGDAILIFFLLLMAVPFLLIWMGVKYADQHFGIACPHCGSPLGFGQATLQTRKCGTCGELALDQDRPEEEDNRCA